MRTRVYSIAVVLRPDVRTIDFECAAGTERVWINDILMLRKKGYNVVGCGAARLARHPSNFPYTKLFYPNNVVDWLDMLGKTSPRYARWIFSTLYVLGKSFFELMYTLHFFFLYRRVNRVYSLGVPLVGLLARSKSTVVYHNLDERMSFFFHAVKKEAAKMTLAFCSQSLLLEFRSKTKLSSPQHFYVLHNAVDVRAFSPKQREFIMSAPFTYRFGYVGTWAKEKGTLVLRDAIRAVQAEKLKQPTSFIIGGDIDVWDMPGWTTTYYRDVKSMIVSSLAAYPNVSFVGKVNYSALPSFYRSLHFLVFPSVWEEPFGNVVIEAMACGTPVIAFRVGAMPEIIVDGENGHIVSEKSSRALAQTIRTIIRQFDAVSYNRMRRRARETVVTKFSDTIRYTALSRLLRL